MAKKPTTGPKKPAAPRKKAAPAKLTAPRKRATKKVTAVNAPQAEVEQVTLPQAGPVIETAPEPVVAATPEPETAPPPPGRSPATRTVLLVQSWLFALALITGGVLFHVLPKQQVSMQEKRRLAGPPVFTWANAFSGKFSDSAEAYYNDNFIYREGWIAAADQMKAMRGWKSEGIEVFAGSGEGGDHATGTARAVPEVPVDEEFRRSKGVIVSKGRAIQMFGGTKASVTPFAQLANRYRQVLGPDVKFYVMAIPSGSDFYLPREVFGGELRERKSIDDLNSMLDPAIVRVPAYDALAPHTGEYIWFHTDHHWTGLGAYYAYRAFAESAGFTPLALNQLAHKRLPETFLGSLYYRTRSPDLAANRDALDYYVVPGETRAWIIRNGIEGGFPAPLYFEKTGGGNSYGVFLGGDNPLMRVVTGQHSGRKIVVIKDSYGNAFTPYLAAHYDEILIVDYRYFKGTIPALMQRYGVKELLYAQNTFAVNTIGTVNLGRKMLGED